MTWLRAAAFGLLLLVGASQPNAATPDLAPSGWAPGPPIPLTLSPAATTAVLWSAYLLGAAALLLGLRGHVQPVRWAVPATLGAAILWTAPFGSADHLNYLAYGQIALEGGDPWSESPIAWQGGGDPLASRVEAPWTTQPSVYGPFATLVHAACAWVGQDNLRVAVWVWQLVVVLAWLGGRALLRGLLDAEHHGRIDLLWTLNPLLVGIGVLGAHLDIVAAVLVLLALRAWSWRGGTGVASAAVAGLAIALAEATKFTYAVAVLGILWLAWRRGWDRRASVFVGSALVGALLLHVPAGLDSYVQVLRSGQTVSLAMPWRPLLEGMLALGLPNAIARSVITLGAAALAIGLAVLLLRATRPVSEGVRPLWIAGMLSAAYAFSASYSLPWYDPLLWAALPAVVPSVLDVLATARLLVIAWAYVPGRVSGMTQGVESLTLGFRRFVAPLLVLAVWVATVWLLRRAGAPPGGPSATEPTPARRGPRPATAD